MRLRGAALVRRVLPQRRLRARLFLRRGAVGARGRFRRARPGAAAGDARARSLLRPRPALAAAARGGGNGSGSSLPARPARRPRRPARAPAPPPIARRGGEPVFLPPALLTPRRRLPP